MKKQTSWEIIYSDFSGMERKAVEFLNKEAGKLIIRDEGVYRIHVLPINKEQGQLPEQNAIVVGRYSESALIRNFVSDSEIPENGYLIKTVKNPKTPECSLIIITASDGRNIFYGAVTLIDKFIPAHAPSHGGRRVADLFFDEPIAEYTYSAAHKIRTRGIFAWGHPINDYRSFIENMARQGLNQIILWNDFKPLNANDIVNYAHEFGIQLLWGFSWGWIDGCRNIQSIDEEHINTIKAQVLEIFERDYAGLGDGIYFQSFTERVDTEIGGKNIAETVTDLVNSTAGELLKRYPELHIQFGLHASSVRNDLDAIARVDERIEILWEDGGAFPYDYQLKTCNEQDFLKALDFTEKIIKLRGKNAKTGLVIKGFATLDWTAGLFVHQRGPFILGENAAEITEHDKKVRRAMWRDFSADWLKYGDHARRFTEKVYEWTDGNVTLSQAGTFDGGIYLPNAIASEIFADPSRCYGDIVNECVAKPCVILD